MKTELQDIAAILDSFQRSSAMDLLLLSPQFELRASKRKSNGGPELRGAPNSNGRGSVETPSQSVAPASVVVQQPQPRAPVTEAPEGHVFIRALNLGTFYRSPKPGAPPYVDVGDPVSSETEVCLIEVMKLFTPHTAGMKGVVREVLVSDGALVEFDQPLFVIEVRD